MGRSKVCWKCGIKKPYSNANLCEDCRTKFYKTINPKQLSKEKYGSSHGGSLARLYSERKRHNKHYKQPKYFSETEFDAAKEKYLYHDQQEYPKEDVDMLVGEGRIVSKKKRDKE